jgi:hypothetical protein
LANKPELGGAIVSVCVVAQYLEFSMSASVQGWRTKWFYIKDRKASSEDEYGLAPFDASKELKKLASWDSPPTSATDPHPTLKGGKGGALSGVQLMAFFVQRRVQPLQHHLSKLWNYSGLVDSSRIFGDLMEKQEVDKRVRNLTKDHAVADLAADYFDSVHPLPKVRIFCIVYLLSNSSASSCVYACIDYFSDLFICRTTNSLFHALLFQRKGLFRLIWPLLFLKPPRLKKIRTEMIPKDRKKIPARRHRLLLRFLKILVRTRRGSVSTSLLHRVPPCRELRLVKPLF